MNRIGRYQAIRMWGRETGSFADYINDQVKKAERDQAPQDALYKRDHIGGDGTWVCVSDLAEDHPFRVRYEEQAA